MLCCVPVPSSRLLQLAVFLPHSPRAIWRQSVWGEIRFRFAPVIQVPPEGPTALIFLEHVVDFLGHLIELGQFLTLSQQPVTETIQEKTRELWAAFPLRTFPTSVTQSQSHSIPRSLCPQHPTPGSSDTRQVWEKA